MKRSRVAVLSSLTLIASGALIFACSGSGDDSDSGLQPDAAKSDSTTTKDSTTDSPFANDGTAKDGATTDSTTEDASDASTEDASDASDAAEITDAGVATTFMVLRVGGSEDAGGADAALGSKLATAVFLEERNISDGSLVRTLDVPIATNGSNQPLTIAGTSTSEGFLTTSSDGHYVVLAGFAATPGTTNVTTSTVFDAGILRVVGRVDHAGNIDTTTLLQAFDESDIRSATSNDGTSFWASGSIGSDAGDVFGGVQYVAFGSTGSTTNITQVPFNTRVVGIFSNQLYTTSLSVPFDGLSSIGSGVPTTTNQTTTLLPGFVGDSGVSTYGFSVLDLDGAVAGVDTIYIAGDGSQQTGGGGVQKWVSNGSTWTQIATFTNGTTVGVRGLAAQIGATGVTILATTTDGNVIKYFDDGSTLTPTGTIIATALANTAYRGIALAPQ